MKASIPLVPFKIFKVITMQEVMHQMVTTVEVEEVVEVEEEEEEEEVEEVLIIKVKIIIKEEVEEVKIEEIDEVQEAAGVVIKTVNKIRDTKKIKNKIKIIDKTLPQNNTAITLKEIKTRISIKNSCNIKIDKMKQTHNNSKAKELSKTITNRMDLI